MATTGIVNTTDLTLFVDDVAVACATDASLNFSNSTREILCKDTSGMKDYDYGIGEWSMSVSALFAFDSPAGGGGVDLLDLAQAKTKVTVKFATAETGDNNWSGEAIITTVSLESSGVGENATYSAEFQGTGDLTKGTNA